MNHEIMKEKVLIYRDRELAVQERKEIEGHLPACEECRGILKRWNRFGGLFSRAALPGDSEAFTRRVMARLARQDEPALALRRWAFLDWLFPTLGYGFAIALMAVAIAHREPFVSAESVLLADMPQNSQWAFTSEPAGVHEILE